MSVRNKDGEEIVAIINGNRVITIKEVDATIISQVQELENKMYNLRVAALNKLITKSLLEMEAAAKGITVADLKKLLVSANVEVEQGRVDQVYLENEEALVNMGEDEAKERIRLDLASHEKMARFKAALDEMKKNAKIDMLFSPPSSIVVNVSDVGPMKGALSASVTIVIFSDFQCPYCKQTAKVLDEILNLYGPKIRIIFKHLPLNIHPEAIFAAQASVCADKQGKFWRYHDLLFNSNTNLSREVLTKSAIGAGLAIEEFNSCLSTEMPGNIVANDIREAQKLKIDGTPTFVINGKLARGVHNTLELRQIIERELIAGNKVN